MTVTKMRQEKQSWAYTAAKVLNSQQGPKKPAVFLRVQLVNHFTPNHTGIDIFNINAQWMRLTIYLDDVVRFNGVFEIENYLKTSIEAYINNSLMFYDEETYLGPVDLTTKHTADKIENIFINETDDAIYLTAIYANFGSDGSNGMKVKKKIKL